MVNGRIVYYVRYVLDMIFKKLKKYKKLVQSLTYIKVYRMIKKNALILILNLNLIIFGVLTKKQPGDHIGTVDKHI